MPHYVDGFVVPVPKHKLDAYRELAGLAGSVWMEYGALHYWECIADDVPAGELTSFPRSVQLKDDETVVLSWIVYASREDRDAINAKAMADPRLAHMMDPEKRPFDAGRMFFGGFRSFLELAREA